MKKSKKLCAGFNGESHWDYIYKNINGKKYCKSCTFKLQKPKAIPPISKQSTFKFKLSIKDKQALKQRQMIEDQTFYTDLWANRVGILYDFSKQQVVAQYLQVNKVSRLRCENPKCEKLLPYEPNLTFFHHILEKRNFPELRHDPCNIAIVCTECHHRYETNPDNIPYLVQLRIKKLREYNAIREYNAKKLKEKIDIDNLNNLQQN